MKVHHSKSWEPDQPGRKNLPVRNHYDAVRLKLLKKTARYGVFQRCWLVNAQLKFESTPLHRRGVHQLAAATWLISFTRR